MRFPRFVENLFKRNAAPEAAANLEARDPALITLISVIYSTQPKTFTGDAVYVTMTAAKSTPTTARSGDDDEDDQPTTTSKTTAKSTSSSSSLTTSSSRSLTTSAPITTSSSLSTSVPLAATITPTAAAATTSTGMSGGAKAGLAFGLIILFALLGGAIFFFLKKRKQDHDAHHKLDDEKDFLALGRKPSAPSSTARSTAPAFGAAAVGGVFGSKLSEKPTPPPPVAETDRRRFSYEEEAPRLSLRAVSQFEPSILGENKNRASAANSPHLSSNASTVVAAAGGAAATKAAIGGPGASKGSLASDPNNPFGNHAEKLSASPPQSIPLPPSPTISAGRISPGPQAADFPLPDSQPITPAKASSPTLSKAEVGGGAAVGAAAIAAATAAAASNKPLVSPAASQGAQAGESVHRVQLDFNPSMDDELEIHAGQLIRVLHEYDDGWALCSRMDRSRQGVVPRTCLSKHPVKPRPQSPGRPGPRGPPPGIRPGGAPPFAQPPRPLSPASNGRQSPSAAPYAQAPRPLTPTDTRNRSNSSSAPFTVYNPNTASPGGSQLRQQESANNKARSNSMSNVNSSPKETSTPSKIPAPVGQVPSRKPVPNRPSP